MKRILYTGLTPPSNTEALITHYPVIKITPYPFSDREIQKALACFEKYSHVIFTSKSSIPILVQYLKAFGYPQAIWKNKFTIAVGQSTAEKLRVYNMEPWLIAKEETAEGIIQELQNKNFSSPHFFWPHSRLSRPLLTAFFIKKNWEWAECILYDTHFFHSEPIPDLNQFDEVMFTSPSTIDGFLKTFKCFPPHLNLKCIGPITKKYLITIKDV